MENVNKPSVQTKASFVNLAPLRNLARRLSHPEARILWLGVAFAICLAIQHVFEQNDYATLEARMDKFRDMSPNGCERKWDGLDYYFICTVK